MATKVEVATAAVATIANKTLKLLCIVSIRGYAKNCWLNRCSYPEKGEHPQYSIDHDSLVKGCVRFVTNDR